MTGGTARLVVIGVGNRDRGDDAVGPVVCDLLRESGPPHIDTVVFEGPMFDLSLHWEPADQVVIVDATAPDGHPGRTTWIDALDARLVAPRAVSTHVVDVSSAIELARVLDRLPAQLTIAAIEGAEFEFGAPLTPAVLRAAGRVVATLSRRADRRVGER